MINIKNLKSLFLEEIETSTEDQNTKEQTTESTLQENHTTKETPSTPPPPPPKRVPSAAVENKRPMGPPPPPQPSETPKPRSKPQIDRRYYDMLMQAIEANNLEGFDYLEFKSSLRALEGLPMDEATKYKSAYATASTMGLTLSKLVNSATFYKNIIDQEKDKFRNALKQKVDKEIVSKENQKRELETMIQQKSAQIKALTEEINQHQSALGNLQGNIDEVKGKIEKTRDSFVATFTHIIAQFDRDIEKIKQYLK